MLPAHTAEGEACPSWARLVSPPDAEPAALGEASQEGAEPAESYSGLVG